jgi:predicted RNA binding protein YcfA (HicA-like mRNA interferase family)
VPPRLRDFRTVLDRNGFALVRQGGSHEIWIRYDQEGRVDRRVPVSRGNAEIRTRRLFGDMLKQAGKTEQHFNEVLNR